MADEKHPLSEDTPPPYCPQQATAPDPYGPAYPPMGHPPQAYGPVPQGYVPTSQTYGPAFSGPGPSYGATGPQYGAAGYPSPEPVTSYHPAPSSSPAPPPPQPQHGGTVTAPPVVIVPASGTSSHEAIMTPQSIPISAAIQATREFDRDNTCKHVLMAIGIAAWIILLLIVENLVQVLEREYSQTATHSHCRNNTGDFNNLTVYQNSP